MCNKIRHITLCYYLYKKNLSRNAEAVCEKLSTPQDSGACSTAFSSNSVK